VRSPARAWEAHSGYILWRLILRYAQDDMGWRAHYPSYLNLRAAGCWLLNPEPAPLTLNFEPIPTMIPCNY